MKLPAHSEPANPRETILPSACESLLNIGKQPSHVWAIEGILGSASKDLYSHLKLESFPRFPYPWQIHFLVEYYCSCFLPCPKDLAGERLRFRSEDYSLLHLLQVQFLKVIMDLFAKFVWPSSAQPWRRQLIPSGPCLICLPQIPWRLFTTKGLDKSRRFWACHLI